MTQAVVAIITHSRPKGLERLLVALSKQAVGAHDVQVLVVDNACDPAVRAMVEQMAQTFPMGLTYGEEAERGIVAARNRCVEIFLGTDAECLLFIDDDSWPATDDWVAKMLDAKAAFGAELVTGPTDSLSGEGTPEWANNVMHDFGGHDDGAVITTFYTNNLLISRHVLETIRPAFDQRFRMSGGSDYHFAVKCSKAGFVARYVNASVLDEFPKSRATVKWFILRGYRSGSAYARAHKFEDGTSVALFKSTMMAAVRFARGIAYIAIGVITLSKARMVNGMFRIASGCGTVSGFFGAKYDEYERIHGA